MMPAEPQKPPALGYRHIIWDWNGTLIDDAWLSVAVINGILAARDRPAIDLTAYRRIFDFPVIRYYERLGFDLERDPFHDIAVAYIEGYDARRLECALHPGVTGALTATAGNGATQSILSAYRQHTLEEVIAHYGLEPYFVRLNGHSDIYGGSKVEAGLRWMGELDHEPHEVLLIGDTVHDFEVAEAIGADCVLLSHGHHDDGRLAATGAPVFRSIAELRASGMFG